MRSDDPVSLVIESRKKILEADPREVPLRKKAELCAALGALAGLVVSDKELVYKMISESWIGLEESVVVQDWIQKGMKKGIEKGVKKGIKKGIEQGIEHGIEQGIEEGIRKGRRAGLVEARRSDLLAVLRSRFGRIGRKLEVRIQRIKDERVLRRLLEKAAVARSLEQFSRSLPRDIGD